VVEFLAGSISGKYLEVVIPISELQEFGKR
jgi:hypothetical protein